MCAHSQPVLECEDVPSIIGLAQALQCANPESMFAMINSYTLYCDAAGGKDHGFIVVAGYLSTYEKWIAFTIKWNLLLATYDLPYFHMKEFAHSTGPFAKWAKDEEHRKRFLSKAAGIISEHVERSFACIVEFDSFDKINQQYELNDIAGVPYSLAGRSCVAKAAMHLPALDANFVFDDGDEGRGELMRIMSRDGYPMPIFRPSRDIIKKGKTIKGIVPLQAADFAAYEVRKVFKDDPTESWPIDRYRKSLQALSDIPTDIDDWGIFRRKELLDLCKAAKAKKR
jgi:hypothetical protein